MLILYYLEKITMFKICCKNENAFWIYSYLHLQKHKYMAHVAFINQLEIKSILD